MANKFRPAQKRFVFKSPDLEISMDEIYRNLGGLFLGPFRFVYSELYSKLYLQANSGAGWSSVASIDLAGNISAAGSFTASATFPRLGV